MSRHLMRNRMYPWSSWSITSTHDETRLLLWCIRVHHEDIMSTDHDASWVLVMHHQYSWAPAIPLEGPSTSSTMLVIIFTFLNSPPGPRDRVHRAPNLDLPCTLGDRMTWFQNKLPEMNAFATELYVCHSYCFTCAADLFLIANVTFKQLETTWCRGDQSNQN